LPDGAALTVIKVIADVLTKDCLIALPEGDLPLNHLRSFDEGFVLLESLPGIAFRLMS